MYESPIEFFTKTVAPKIAAEIDEKAFEAVFQCGFNVDRDELEKALRYDRDQWRKGFDDGVEHAQPKWISVKDRMPEEKKGEPSDLVLVACVYWETDEVFINTDITVDGEWVNFGEPDYEITHWMPLPTPPKEE